MSVKSFRVSVAGASLWTRLEGADDAPVVTFSNSLMTDSRLWEDQARMLASRFRVLCYDTRGHGQSSASPAPYDFEMLANDVVAIWDALGIGRSHFVGLSMGGMTGMPLALKHSARLRSLTLCSMRADAPSAFRESWETRIKLAQDQGMSALSEATVDRWFPHHFDDATVRAKVRHMVSDTQIDGFIGGVRAIQGLDYLRSAATITLPTMLLAGGDDGALPDTMRDLAGVIPNADFRVFPSTGHLVNLERPDEFSCAIEHFAAAY